MSVRIEHDDMLQAIPRLVAAGVVCDAVVTDPPYHLTPTVKRFGAPTAAPPKSVMTETRETRSNQYGRLCAGFMGQQWDGGDIAFRPETWATVATILRPGAFLLAFGGTRTYHRLACAIEDGGFVIQDCIMWLFGTGFPKRRDMLKPAYEPIVVAYKPGGARTMQIDECRIHTDDSANRHRHGGGVDGTWSEFSLSTAGDKHELPDGRWPANVCHDGSEEATSGFPADMTSGKEVSRSPDTAKGYRPNAYGAESRPSGVTTEWYGDTGSAARYFYTAKADRQDRWGSRHPTVKPVELMRWLVKLVCPPYGLFLDPFAGSGTAAVAALAEGRNAILIEREDNYVTDIRERIAFYEGDGRHSMAAKARRTEDKPLGGLFNFP